MAHELHLAQIAAVDHRNASAPPRTVHPIAADDRRTMQCPSVIRRVTGLFVAGTFSLLHPRQAPDADDLRILRIADVERPDHALLPSRRVVRKERELAFVVDAEAMRPVARQVVESDLLRLAAF